MSIAATILTSSDADESEDECVLESIVNLTYNVLRLRLRLRVINVIVSVGVASRLGLWQSTSPLRLAPNDLTFKVSGLDSWG